MKTYKPKNQTYADAFKGILSVNHHLNIEFTEGHYWHEVALSLGVMHWFEEVDEFANLPKSIQEIEGKHWYEAIGDVTSKERAEAFLALMQLVELRDAWIEGCNTPFDPNTKHTIIYRNGEIVPRATGTTNRVLSFQTRELRDQFLAQFRNLIETAKELI